MRPSIHAAEEQPPRAQRESGRVASMASLGHRLAAAGPRTRRRLLARRQSGPMGATAAQTVEELVFWPPPYAEYDRAGPGAALLTPWRGAMFAAFAALGFAAVLVSEHARHEPRRPAPAPALAPAAAAPPIRAAALAGAGPDSMVAQRRIPILGSASPARLAPPAPRAPAHDVAATETVLARLLADPPPKPRVVMMSPPPHMLVAPREP
jgi:hypothetical protein